MDAFTRALDREMEEYSRVIVEQLNAPLFFDTTPSYKRADRNPFPWIDIIPASMWARETKQSIRWWFRFGRGRVRDAISVLRHGYPDDW